MKLRYKVRGPVDHDVLADIIAVLCLDAGATDHTAAIAYWSTLRYWSKRHFVLMA